MCTVRREFIKLNYVGDDGSDVRAPSSWVDAISRWTDYDEIARLFVLRFSTPLKVRWKNKIRKNSFSIEFREFHNFLKTPTSHGLLLFLFRASNPSAFRWKHLEFLSPSQLFYFFLLNFCAVAARPHGRNSRVDDSREVLETVESLSLIFFLFNWSMKGERRESEVLAIKAQFEDRLWVMSRVGEESKTRRKGHRKFLLLFCTTHEKSSSLTSKFKERWEIVLIYFF